MPMPQTRRKTSDIASDSTPEPSLAAKKLPAQQRATETYERILEAAAQTLIEVGVERLSTNLVCMRAGVSPPALYRYFPNKYALFAECADVMVDGLVAALDEVPDGASLTDVLTALGR